MQLEFIFVIVILILSIVIHEVSHGYVANMLGDPTARLSGRLTLNPISHIDPLGSVIIPGLLVLTGAQILFGWAKPVPYNPYNLRNARWGEALVAGAGPFVNIAIALLFGILIRLGIGFGFASPEFIELASVVVYINLLLAFFNLFPIPPLDGSKVIKPLLPFGLQRTFANFEGFMARYGFIAVFAFIFIFFFFLWPIFSRFLVFLFSVITGVGFF